MSPSVFFRLPLYQGPAMTYVVPLLAMQSLPEWQCPDVSARYGKFGLARLTFVPHAGFRN